MEVLHSQKVFFPLCLLLSLHFSLPLLLGSAYTLPDKYFIDCGSSSDTTLTDGRIFVGDRKFSAGKGQAVENSNSSKDIYQTARVYREPSSYKLEINQNGTYMVRLHFQVFNTSSANLADAVFNVLASTPPKKDHFPASGFSLLTNFSIQNSTGSPVVKEFLLTIPQGFFRLHFDPSQENETSSLAFVNAIEVFLLPDNFLSDNTTRVNSAGVNSTYRGLLSEFLNKIHRIKVGGDPVKQEDDKLSRNWVSDEPYLLNKTAAKNSTTYTREPNYKDQLSTQLSSEYIAPSLVYQTAKELNTDDNSSILTWRFPVKKTAKHLVRTHFCDIVSNTANVLWFNLYIYNFSQYINSYDRSTELATPFYFDFVVDSDNSGYMNISIGVQNDSVIKNAYLNGLEIMEVMNETVSIPKEREPKKNYFKVGCGSVGALIIVVVAAVLGFKFWKSDKDQSLGLYGISFNNSTGKNSNPSLPPNLNLSLRISLGNIKKATRNFSPKNFIGEGGFGTVYKGILDGKKVAVKRSRPGHGQGLQEFHTEIIVLSQIRHRHLVSLIGYCDERSEMILVYEFMEKGTLREHLYDSSSDSNNSGEKSCSRSELSWKKRLEICIGAAIGIEYLHTGPSGGIIHRDLKSTNILLDEDYVAKVADFGLSKSSNLESVSMDVKGTFGYLDPEYFQSGQFTEKSDVFAFGVVLLEVLCARPVINNLLPQEEVYLADWVLHYQMKGGLLEEIIDPMLVGKIKPSSLRKFFETAEKCLKINSVERPNMHDVVYDLQYALLLQETAMHRDPNEDKTTTTTTTTNSSLQLQLQFPVEWNLSSNSMRIDEDEEGTLMVPCS